MIRFGVITDIQYADKDDTSKRFYRQSLEKTLKACGHFLKEDVAFVFNLGDLIDEGWNHLTVMNELLSHTRLTWRHVLGNHDFLIPQEKKARVYELLSLPKPGYDDFQLSDAEDVENRWRLIRLNGNEISSYAALSNEEVQNASQVREQNRLGNGCLPEDWNGAVSETQLNWLRSRLTEAKQLHEKVIVCSHFPLMAQGASFSQVPKIDFLQKQPVFFSEMGISTWNGQEILKILEEFDCVKAYFAGHLHQGGYGVKDGIHHVTFHGVCEAVPNAYSVVSLFSNKIVIQGFERQPSFEFVLS